MRRVARYIVFSGLALALPSLSVLLYGQDRCATVAYNKSLHANPTLYQIEFEEWLTKKNTTSLSRMSRQEVAPYRIPVVVHIIHNGEPIGTGANISEEQIHSQIKVLNEDFNRLNADTVNTPAVFAGVAGKLNIEFVLAKQNEEGLATNGIVRVNGGRSGWTINDNYALKELSYWPAENYLNIWVANITDTHAGWAQFPESNLDGLNNSSTNRLTDGIVIWHKAFGSADDGPFNLDPLWNKGRTATHETGHFFGLNHIWGIGVGCNDTDYVADTPNQGGQSSGCPTHPKADNCSDMVMFQNFLDYSDDDCMNIFTQGQVDRMIIVLENSPRRNSLLTSPGLLDPAPLPNDLGIRSIIAPDASICSNDIIPVIELRNYGSNTVTAGRVRFILDGLIRETKDFTLSLDPLAATQVAFSPVTLPSGTHGFTFQVLLTNGGTDSESSNDEKSVTVIVPTFGSTPFVENFEAPPTGWIILNPDGQITWEIANAPKETSGNQALKLNYLDYEDKLGELDVFLSPILDLTSAPAATLSFDVAHARYQLSNDRLKVIVLTNCQNIYSGTVVYDKAGDALKTAPPTTQPFVPTGPDQWRKELIDLSAFAGSGSVQLAFVGVNDYGNNIYIDNISFFTEDRTDVSLLRLARPSVVTCEEQIVPSIDIQNAGSEPLNEVTVTYSLNSASAQTVTLGNIGLSFGEEKAIDLPQLTLLPGLNTLSVTLHDPNGVADFNPGDNGQVFTIVVNQSQDRIPLRQNFEDDFLSSWTIVNPFTEAGMNWQTIGTNYGQSLYFNSWNNNVRGDESWLVSPVLDFSATDHASMAFDLSSAASALGEERLTILASTDCGSTFSEVSYNFPPPRLEGLEWVPDTPEEWTKDVSVNLNSLAGQSNVRIAFVVRNEQGNNLFIDNLEFFVTADPTRVEVEGLYSIYGYDLTHPEFSDLKIAFNLPERQHVRFSVINITGQIETDGMLRDVLNQTYPLELPHRLQPGVYFIRLQIGQKFYSTKVLVN